MKALLETDEILDVPETEQPPLPVVVELPDLIDAADFLTTPIDPPAELVAGILHKGSKLAFGGSSKSFKTWTLLDLAISVATGADWLGRSTAKGKVLFLNFEIQPHAWQRRIATVAKAKGVEIQPGQIILWNLRGHAADFRQIIPRIIERARRENFALIVLDPIYKLYGGTDENAAGDVAALLNSLEKLATETGAAIAFGTHFAKGNAAGKEAIGTGRRRKNVAATTRTQPSASCCQKTGKEFTMSKTW
jgi:RecA-family ATPase